MVHKDQYIVSITDTSHSTVIIVDCEQFMNISILYRYVIPLYQILRVNYFNPPTKHINISRYDLSLFTPSIGYSRVKYSNIPSEPMNISRYNIFLYTPGIGYSRVNYSNPLTKPMNISRYNIFLYTPRIGYSRVNYSNPPTKPEYLDTNP